MKLKALYQDLKAVLKKHFKPEPDIDPTEVKLLKMVSTLQKQQTDLNMIREGLGESVRLLNDSEVLKEFGRLQRLAPGDSESGGTVTNRSDKDMDRMFI